MRVLGLQTLGRHSGTRAQRADPESSRILMSECLDSGSALKRAPESRMGVLGLLGLDLRRTDHVAPLGDLRLLERPELGRRAADQVEAERRGALLHLGIAQRVGDLLV